MEKLFVYGIFLSQNTRDAYYMVGHRYATVQGYVTVGKQIVQAVKTDNPSVALTGVITEIHPDHWARVDRLEAGYDRIRVKTTDNEEVWMYAEPKRYREVQESDAEEVRGSSREQETVPTT